MQNFKNKLYDFEAAPPEHIWAGIKEDLYDNTAIKRTSHKKSKKLYYLFCDKNVLFIEHGHNINYKNI